MWALVSASYLWGAKKLHTALALPAVLYLAGVLGLVNSRTILLYVAAVAALAAVWRLRQGRAGNRLFAVSLFALAAVVAVQLALNTLLGWLGGTPVETALQRVGGSSFAMSARDLEWRNAWRVFRSAPLFGHGWDSFSLQGFLAAEFPQGYSPNGISVLFTHSHNIVLQLLAEMGLVGTLLVFGGAVWVVKPFFRRPATAACLFPLMLMAVSLCHSMLEYPLWYIYFLVPFALMAGAAPSERRPFQTAWGIPALLPAALALVIAAGTVKLGFVYYDLTAFAKTDKNDDYAAVGRKIDGLRAIAAKEPLLAYYAELALTRRASPSDNVIKPWAEKAARRALRHRPYATASQYGLYQYRTGDPAQAEAWMRQLYRYYPSSMKYYVPQIRRSPHFSPLYPDLYRACNEYQKLKPRTESCPPP
ncbi:Wzy polymerase domain-containing protein [Kingella potus]|uniref:PglL family O-oligosaccharyltransferase n=1 Tax=Kingella potus TaxID=265175 RepID=UPI003CC7C870